MTLPKLHWKKEWTQIAAILIILRLVYAGIGAGVLLHGGPAPLNAEIYNILLAYLKQDPFSHWFVNIWFQWDTVSYFNIAMNGYNHEATIASMPLYPLLIHILAPALGGNYLLSALLISTTLSFIFLILLFELLSELYPKEIVLQALLAFVTFPTFFFLLAGYTESLFLTLVLAFWILARKRDWWAAGVFAGLATAARMQGLILAPVIAWMIIVSLVRHPEPSSTSQIQAVFKLLKNSWKTLLSSYRFAWLAVSFPVIAAGIYQFWQYRAGWGTVAASLQKYWLIKTVMPWEGMILFLQRLFTTKYIYMDWIDLAFSLYIWLTFAVLFTRGTPPHLLASFSRYFLALFPLCILPAMIHNKYLQAFIFFVFFAMQLLLTQIFLSGSWVA